MELSDARKMTTTIFKVHQKLHQLRLRNTQLCDCDEIASPDHVIPYCAMENDLQEDRAKIRGKQIDSILENPMDTLLLNEIFENKYKRYRKRCLRETNRK